MEIIEIRSRKDIENKVKDVGIFLKSFNVYCRVSTTSQIENTSLQTQSELGIDYCKKNHSEKYNYTAAATKNTSINPWLVGSWA